MDVDGWRGRIVGGVLRFRAAFVDGGVVVTMLPRAADGGTSLRRCAESTGDFGLWWVSEKRTECCVFFLLFCCDNTYGDVCVRLSMVLFEMS